MSAGPVSRNPATGELLATFDDLTPDEVTARIERSHQAFLRHRTTPLDERAARLRRAADILEAEAAALGRMITLEMGRPIAAAVAEIEKCASACRYYADHGAAFLADEHIDLGGERHAIVRYQPLGPVLAVMPWNFPFWQVFRFAAPALMAGNVGVLKHASNVPQCALAIEDVLRRAGFDGDEFQTLLVGAAAVDGIIRDDRVRAVTLTGSEGAGAAVAQSAGAVLKKTVLELGGSDPFIVMPSADLDAAVATAVTARTINNGQSCIAAKRFIVADAVYDAFAAAFVGRMRALRIGDPLDERTQIGPLATASIRDELAQQVDDTIARGARLLTGGRSIDGPGWFYEPTVLDAIPADSPAYRDELFGPVAALFRVRDVDEAVHIANDTKFGLGSAAWTNDVAEQRRFMDGIEAGQVFINGMVASDPRVPFGGVKASGYGRELARAGMLEFVNMKSIVTAGADTGDAKLTE
jgi:succinate-semialdehyde dehydrogenase / glutarate-semialdehyde dehydrogenase